MGQTAAPRGERRRWAVGILILLAFNVMLLGTRGGACADYVAQTGGTCTIRFGAGTWVMVVTSLFAMAYCVHRLLRAVGERRDRR
ncbi:hypothetical protein PU560_15340 [Georgenia sp. 10Sc9-8]|uniref:Uncharacterized protein n=1 Tax=Georgenia halotolerans TaxID=3028317 RepID=A0ABT5U0G9_9MICO|nr:hypothetical protein [Georgenia halotolerans]